jgi:hypothetical protein
MPKPNLPATTAPPPAQHGQLLPRRRRARLRSTADVARELRALYVRALNGEIDPSDASRLSYILVQLRETLEKGVTTEGKPVRVEVVYVHEDIPR